VKRIRLEGHVEQMGEEEKKKKKKKKKTYRLLVGKLE
jgi:hypothetical protein